MLLHVICWFALSALHQLAYVCLVVLTTATTVIVLLLLVLVCGMACLCSFVSKTLNVLKFIEDVQVTVIASLCNWLFKALIMYTLNNFTL
jgi:hypothetical protein